VGCHHPVRLSNTYLLYLQGWHGLAIDANAAFGLLFAELRPKDTFIHAAVSDTEQDVEFTVYADPALSSLSGTPLLTAPNNMPSPESRRCERGRLSHHEVGDLARLYTAPEFLFGLGSLFARSWSASNSWMGTVVDPGYACASGRRTKPDGRHPGPRRRKDQLTIS
jgi:hypothetical protein